MKYFMIVAPLLAVVLNGCAAISAPTIDPAQVQASAAAAAGTMIALTQAAIPPTQAPTSTLAPSPTPLPSSTSVPILSTLAAPTSTSSSATGDPCSGYLGSNPAGPKANIILFNKSSGQANISIYVSKTKFGQCGYRSYSLARGASTTITDLPLSCYSFYAFINSKKPTHSSGGGCWNNPDRIYIDVEDTIIHLTVTHP